jgi:hypothetical protein
MIKRLPSPTKQWLHESIDKMLTIITMHRTRVTPPKTQMSISTLLSFFMTATYAP